MNNFSNNANTAVKFNKRTMFSLGLLIAFFLPWLNFIIFKLSGFRIPIAYDILSSMGSLFGNAMLYVKLSYLLYLIPICIIYNTLIDLKLLSDKKKYFLNEFVVGLIFSGLIFILAVTSEFNLAFFGIGFWLTLLFSILGIMLDRHRLQKNWAVAVNNFQKYSGNLQEHSHNFQKHGNHFTSSFSQDNNFRVDAIRNLKATGKPFDEYDVELEIEKLQKAHNEQFVRDNEEQKKTREEERSRKRERREETAKKAGIIIGSIFFNEKAKRIAKKIIGLWLIFLLVSFLFRVIFGLIDDRRWAAEQAIREAERIEMEAKWERISTPDGVLINGVRWATRNVDTRGTFAVLPESRGRHFDWNSRNACPLGWRLPTQNELSSLMNAGSVWITRNGVNGRLFGTAPNQIFLPAAGNAIETSFNVGTLGDYWSSENAVRLNFNSGISSMGSTYRFMRLSVRCVAE